MLMPKVGDPNRAKPIKMEMKLKIRIYNRKDFDRNLVIEERTEIVAKKLTEFLKGLRPFCQNHCVLCGH
jgi:type I restriction enzyme, R subunit